MISYLTGNTMGLHGPLRGYFYFFFFLLACCTGQQFNLCSRRLDRLCALVVRIPDYRSRGSGYDSGCYQIVRVAVGLKMGPLRIVRTTEDIVKASV
jgi:hypothetical protein